MKKRVILIALASVVFGAVVWFINDDSGKYKAPPHRPADSMTARSDSKTVSDYSPSNFYSSSNHSGSSVKTEYGDLMGYKTVDEYYVQDGRKVWHGHRKTLYPSGILRMDARYEHGNELWHVSWDESGQIVEDTRPGEVKEIARTENSAKDQFQGSKPQETLIRDKPEEEFRHAHCITQNLRVRKHGDLKSEMVYLLSIGDNIMLTGNASTDSITTSINGDVVKGNFLEVETDNGTRGWVFSGGIRYNN